MRFCEELDLDDSRVLLALPTGLAPTSPFKSSHVSATTKCQFLCSTLQDIRRHHSVTEMLLTHFSPCCPSSLAAAGTTPLAFHQGLPGYLVKESLCTRDRFCFVCIHVCWGSWTIQAQSLAVSSLSSGLCQLQSEPVHPLATFQPTRQ